MHTKQQQSFGGGSKPRHFQVAMEGGVKTGRVSQGHNNNNNNQQPQSHLLNGQNGRPQTTAASGTGLRSSK